MHVRNWELSLPPCRMLICFWSGLPLPTPGRWKCWGNACVLKKAKKKVVFVQWLSPVQLFATPWTAACQAPLSSTISQRLLKFMSIESGMLSDRLILCCNTFGQKEKRKLLNQRKQKRKRIVRLPAPHTMLWRNKSTVMLWDRVWK